MLPVVVTMLLGVWEVGRLAQITQIVTNAAREGARMAAGGSFNSIPVTVAMVQTEVQNYLTSAGIPSAAVTGAQVTLTNQSSNSWTNPSDATPLDKFSVTVTIPSGTPYNALRLGLTSTITGVSSLTVTQSWFSSNDSVLTVSTQLPY